jgi:hypothetical protein
MKGLKEECWKTVRRGGGREQKPRRKRLRNSFAWHPAFPSSSQPTTMPLPLPPFSFLRHNIIKWKDTLERERASVLFCSILLGSMRDSSLTEARTD